MYAGEVVEQGTVEEIFYNPNTSLYEGIIEINTST